MNFFDNPQLQPVFGTSVSASAELLRSQAPPAALMAAIREGWFDLAALTEVDPEGQPWLAHWLDGIAQRGQRANSPWNETPWPTTPEGDWAEVAPRPDIGAFHTTSLNTQAELVMGWMLANAPDGVGRMRWNMNSSFTSQTAAPQSGSIIAQLLKLEWKKAFGVAMERTDRPSPEELKRLEIPLGNRGLVAQGSAGNTSVYSNQPFAPLLHWVVQENLVEFLPILVEAGADLHQCSRDGTPLHYRATKTQTLERLIELGGDLLQRHPLDASPESFWDYAYRRNSHLSSMAEMSAVANAWMRENLSPETMLKRKMPELSSLMADPSSFAAFDRQVKQLKIPATIEWEEHGQSWTWPRQGLALLLEASPSESTPSAWDWAVSKPLSGTPLFEGVPNEDVLWLIGLANESAEKSWSKQAKKHQWASPLESKERTQALLKILQEKTHPLWKTPGKTPATRNGWLIELGGELRRRGADPRPVWDLVSVDPEHSHSETAFRWAAVLLVEARHLLQNPAQENLDKAGQHLADAIVLSQHIRPDRLQPLVMLIDGESSKNNSLTEDLFEQMGEALMHAVGVLKEQGGVLDDGAQGHRIQQALTQWADHPIMKEQRPAIAETLLDQQLPQATPQRRPSPRF
jgi:hypothetical protein